MSEKPFTMQKIPSILIAIHHIMWTIAILVTMFISALGDSKLAVSVGAFLMIPAFCLTGLLTIMALFDWSAFDD